MKGPSCLADYRLPGSLELRFCCQCTHSWITYDTIFHAPHSAGTIHDCPRCGHDSEACCHGPETEPEPASTCLIFHTKPMSYCWVCGMWFRNCFMPRCYRCNGLQEKVVVCQQLAWYDDKVVADRKFETVMGKPGMADRDWDAYWRKWELNADVVFFRECFPGSNYVPSFLCGDTMGEIEDRGVALGEA